MANEARMRMESQKTPRRRRSVLSSHSNSTHSRPQRARPPVSTCTPVAHEPETPRAICHNGPMAPALTHGLQRAADPHADQHPHRPHRRSRPAIRFHQRPKSKTWNSALDAETCPNMAPHPGIPTTLAALLHFQRMPSHTSGPVWQDSEYSAPGAKTLLPCSRRVALLPAPIPQDHQRPLARWHAETSMPRAEPHPSRLSAWAD